MKEYLFIGERRSEQAKRNNWSWQNGISTARFLFSTLREIGIEPDEQMFMNLWDDEGELQEIPTDRQIIAMGRIVQEKLSEMGIEHIGITHPAVRGAIRKRERYVDHLTEQLIKEGR